MPKLIDLTGKIFGKLTVLERDNTKKHEAYQVCKCECGNIKSIQGSALRTGKTLSCGCLRKETAKINMKNNRQDISIDETGNRYGKLTVLYKVPNNKTGGCKQHCLCDCGNEIDVIGQSLRNGNTKSCGCLGKSAGEQKIEEIFSQSNINFCKEYTQIIKNKKLRYDFAVFENQKLSYLIEFDGQQHQIPSNLFGGEKYLKYIQEHDELKNQWCKDNNIPLIRIPYTHLKDLCIEDLLLETSQFII